MTSDPEDEGLSWGDEKDPTYVESSSQIRADRPAVTPGASAAERRAAAEARRATAPTTGSAVDAGPVATNSVVLVVLGLLGGIYLLYTVGWFISAQRNIALPVNAFDVVMTYVREGLSVAAPALWFGCTLLFTRHSKPLLRVLWLVLGALVLIPLPFVLGV